MSFTVTVLSRVGKASVRDLPQVQRGEQEKAGDGMECVGAWGDEDLCLADGYGK